MDDTASNTSTGPAPDPKRGVGRANLAEARLYRLAMRQGWPVPREVKALAVERMVTILRDDKGGARAHTAAMKALVSATTATTSSIGVAVQAKNTELEDRLAELERKAGPGGQP